MSRLKALSFSLLSALLLVVAATVIHAQTNAPQNFDATVSPVFFDLTGQENSTVNQTIKLRNNTSSDLTVKAEVKKMGADEQGNLTIKDQDDGTVSWIEVATPNVTIKAKEWANIPFSIKIPKDAAFGYYWAITFVQDNGQALKTSGAKINATIAVPVLLNVPRDGAKTEGKITGFSTDTFTYEYPPVIFKTIFSNSGNVHVRPKGNIFIKDWLGRPVATLDINQSQGAILPNMKRTFETQWNDGFVTYENKLQDGEIITEKNGQPRKELKFHFDKILDLRIGRYTANALVVLPGEKRDIAYEATTSFVIFPWKIVLGTIIFVLLAGVGLFSTIKSAFKKIKNLFGGKRSHNES